VPRFDQTIALEHGYLNEVEWVWFKRAKGV
jgi:hypothetical protein